MQYDAKHAARSFAIFDLGSEQPARVVRSGERIGAYELERIGRGMVVLKARAGRCSLRLHGRTIAREPRAMPAAIARSYVRPEPPPATQTSRRNETQPVDDSLARND